MAIKKYNYDYDFCEASAHIEIDTEKFTKENALATLNFFDWDWDEEEDPIFEVVKKYALEAIRQATFNNYNTQGVIGIFKNLEGFASVDGKFGIKLIYVSAYEFQEDKLTLLK